MTVVNSLTVDLIKRSELEGDFSLDCSNDNNSDDTFNKNSSNSSNKNKLKIFANLIKNHSIYYMTKHKDQSMDELFDLFLKQNPKLLKFVMNLPGKISKKYEIDCEKEFPMELVELYSSKLYMKSGFYSQCNKNNQLEIFKFKFPMYHGDLLLKTEKDFELPYDLSLYESILKVINLIN